MLNTDESPICTASPHLHWTHGFKPLNYGFCVPRRYHVSPTLPGMKHKAFNSWLVRNERSTALQMHTRNHHFSPSNLLPICYLHCQYSNQLTKLSTELPGPDGFYLPSTSRGLAAYQVSTAQLLQCANWSLSQSPGPKFTRPKPILLNDTPCPATASAPPTTATMLSQHRPRVSHAASS